MFAYCSSLTSLNLSNFNTSKVKSMQGMFNGCSSLTSLNLSNFDTSKVESMWDMFRYCSSLTSLNLSNFDTSKVSLMKEMFYNCINLEYINMKNFKETSLLKEYYDMFTNVPDNIVVCINKNNIPNIYPQIQNIKCHIEDCTDNWKFKQSQSINCSTNCSYYYFINNISLVYKMKI